MCVSVGDVNQALLFWGLMRGRVWEFSGIAAAKPSMKSSVCNVGQ